MTTFDEALRALTSEGVVALKDTRSSDHTDETAQPSGIATLARQLLATKDEKERLNAELRGVNAEYDAIEGSLITQLQVAGLLSFKLTPENVTMTVSERLWARPHRGTDDDETARNRSAVSQALSECGWDWLIKSDFNVVSLSTAIRETLDRGEDIPEGILTVLDIGKEPTIRMAGANRKRI